jgi:hypothetical protein
MVDSLSVLAQARAARCFFLILQLYTKIGGKEKSRSTTMRRDQKEGRRAGPCERFSVRIFEQFRGLRLSECRSVEPVGRVPGGGTFPFLQEPDMSGGLGIDHADVGEPNPGHKYAHSPVSMKYSFWILDDPF